MRPWPGSRSGQTERLPGQGAGEPDWQAFQALCYPESEAPSPEDVQADVGHLGTAAKYGHAPAKHPLATELLIISPAANTYRA